MVNLIRRKVVTGTGFSNLRRRSFPDESRQCATFAFMNKQPDPAKETPSQPYNTLELCNTTGSLSHYIVYNLFRILRPKRKKFNLTINEIIILNGMMLYNKYLGSSFS